MSLKGSLQTVALSEVLQLLSSTGKSGALYVVGDDGEGRLWFADGRMSAFSAGAADEPFEAVYELLRVPSGEFSFIAGEVPAGDAISIAGGAEVASTLAAAEERLVEWHEITGVVPSLDHHLELISEPAADVVSLDRTQWAMVVAVGDGRSVRDVLGRVGLKEFEGCRAVRVAVDAGLLTVGEPVAASVTPFAPLSLVTDEPAPEEAHEAAFASAEVTEPEGEVSPAAEIAEGVESLPGALLRFGVASPAGEEAAPLDGEVTRDPLALAAGDAEIETFAVDGPEQEATGPALVDFFSSSATVSDDDMIDGVPGDYVYTPVVAADDEAVVAQAPAEQTADSDDRYAALRAAIMEVNDTEGSVADYGYHHDDAEQPAPVQQYEIGTEPDGRAALEALLNEVRGEEEAAYEAAGGQAGWDSEDVQTWQAPAYEPVDGLADRGPWTEHELASMESQTWSDQAGHSDGGDVVAFGVAPADAPEAAAADPSSDATPAEADPAPAEEPMNRGLLLKFLSSVRN